VRGGRFWAYVGAVLGAGASVAANVAHSFVPPVGAGMAWRPPAGAVIGAMLWPIFLLVAVEILSRVDWPTGPVWICVRWIGLLPVACVAALVSYRHMSGLLTAWHEDYLTAMVGPLAVDGLMVMATAALVATRPVPDPDSTAEAIAESTDPTLSRLLRAIADQELLARPSAEAIRKHLGIAAARARALRDILRGPNPTGPVEEAA
jgi:hypothetical protein